MLLQMKWTTSLELLRARFDAGEIRVHSDEARTLDMSSGTRRKIELEYGFRLERVKVAPRRMIQSPSVKSKSSSPVDLWHFDAIGLTAARNANRIGTGAGVTVAILDTGVDGSHPEFRGKKIRACQFDASGNRKLLRRSTDQDGHGTFNAGLICGATVGIAPNAQLVSAVVLQNNQGTDTGILAGVNWILSLPDVHIVLMAFGSFAGNAGLYQSVIDELLHVGILPVIAVGNEGPDLLLTPGNTRGGLVVGWMNRDMKVDPMSSSGKMSSQGHTYRLPSLVAPGRDVYSSFPDGKYDKLTGATPATAIVAGVAALAREQFPKISPEELRDRLLASCQKLKLPVARQGAGLVQIEGHTQVSTTDLLKANTALRQTFDTVKPTETVRAILILNPSPSSTLTSDKPSPKPTDFPTRAAYRKALLALQKDSLASSLGGTIQSLKNLSLKVQGGTVTRAVVVEGAAKDLLASLALPGVRSATLDQALEPPPVRKRRK